MTHAFTKAAVFCSLVLTGTATVAFQSATANQAIEESTAARVIDVLASSLERNFVFREVGLRYARYLRQMQTSGAYRGLSPADLARHVTADLQAVFADGHLRLRAPSPKPLLGAPSAAHAERESKETGIERSGWLAPHIAYISFKLFPGSDASIAAVGQFLQSHSAAHVLIIDVRTHGGGFTDEFDVIASYLYDKPTELMNFDTREAAYRPRADTPTLKRISGPEGIVREVELAVPLAQPTALSRARIFVLTSGFTGSAAEHLTLALKRTGRATIVGETTAGMGHFGRVVELPAGFTAVIPIGRPFDPGTGKDWEGSGVTPHIQVPAKDALAVTLRLLGWSDRVARRTSVRWMPSGAMDRIIPLRTAPVAERPGGSTGSDEGGGNSSQLGSGRTPIHLWRGRDNFS